jgi:hypothetical protein
VREGDAADVPGAPKFFWASVPNVFHNGQIVFTAGLAPANGSNQSGVWAWQNNGLKLVARSDAVPAGASPSLPMRSIGQAGAAGTQIAFFEGDVNANAEVRIWAGEVGGLRLVAEEDTGAPGTGAGVQFARFTSSFQLGTFRPVVNSVGDVAFRSTLAGPGVNSTNDIGTWFWRNGQTTLVARKGDTAPDLSPDSKFTSLQLPVINDRGEIAFSATANSPTTGFTHGIWAGPVDALALIAQRGEIAPGTIDRTHYDFDSPILGGGGQVVFAGMLSGPNGGTSSYYGLWTGTAGDLDLIAMTGDILPDSPAGLVLRDFNLGTQTNASINSRGDVLFQAILAESPTSFGAGSGVWAFVDGELLKLAVGGDVLDVDPSHPGQDLRTISSVSMIRSGGGQDGYLSGLNDDRIAVLNVFFRDGSNGIFTFTVPEPSAFLLGALAVVGLLVYRRTDSGR